MASTNTTVSLLSLLADDDMQWAERGECRRKRRDGSPFYDLDLWHPIGTTGPARVQIDEAKAVCRRCPVVLPCAAWAVDRLEWGVAGALDQEERRAIRRERARAAREQAAAS